MLTGVEDAECCILTSGATWALNQAILGFVRPGDRVLTSSLEHNAVLRPLYLAGADAEAVPCDALSRTDPDEVSRRIRPDTRLVVMNHASNVCGSVLPAREIAEICAAKGFRSAGRVADGGASESFGHPGFRLRAARPQGAVGAGGHRRARDEGGISRRASAHRRGRPAACPIASPWPDFLPDRFEPGTANIPGIYGLDAALSFLTPNQAQIFAHDLALAKRFLDGLSQIRGVRVPGGFGAESRVAVVSVAFETVDNAAAAHALERKSGIMTRCGLHCSPAAHRVLGSYPAGGGALLLRLGQRRRESIARSGRGRIART